MRVLLHAVWAAILAMYAIAPVGADLHRSQLATVKAHAHARAISFAPSSQTKQFRSGSRTQGGAANGPFQPTAAKTCLLYRGPAGDSRLTNGVTYWPRTPRPPADPTPNYDAADITDVDLTVDDKTVTFTIHVVDLGGESGPKMYGHDIMYTVYFSTNKHPNEFIQAMMGFWPPSSHAPADAAMDYWYGAYPYLHGGTLSHGSVDFVKSTITMPIPRSELSLDVDDAITPWQDPYNNWAYSNPDDVVTTIADNGAQPKQQYNTKTRACEDAGT